MVLRLHVWGPAFGLPSIDAECVAATAYLNRTVPAAKWVLVADYDTSISPREQFPILFDGVVSVTGFAGIVSYLCKSQSGLYDLDNHLDHKQRTDRNAFASFLQSTSLPLIDLSLYVSSENYNAATSTSYTAILPWYLNYTLPPARRDLARARTAHLGISGLDVSTIEQDGTTDFEAAKRDAGIPTAGRSTQPKVLSMGRSKGVQGLLSSPVYAARFKLDALTNELLDPLSDLLGKKEYLFDGHNPSSIDCLAFGYLSLMFYAPVPQAWIKEALLARFPHIVKYIERMREELVGHQDIKPADVWSISQDNRPELSLPWRPRRRRPLYYPVATAVRELVGSLPLVSRAVRRGVVIQTTAPKPLRHAQSSLPSPYFVNSIFAFTGALVAALAGMVVYHRRNPREGDLLFLAVRPLRTGFGEAENILSVLANQLPRAPIA